MHFWLMARQYFYLVVIQLWSPNWLNRKQKTFLNDTNVHLLAPKIWNLLNLLLTYFIMIKVDGTTMLLDPWREQDALFWNQDALRRNEFSAFPLPLSIYCNFYFFLKLMCYFLAKEVQVLQEASEKKNNNKYILVLTWVLVKRKKKVV